MHPCKKYLDVICNFPTPAILMDMHSWFGLINQVSYAFTVTDHMLPFCQLLNFGTPFHWKSKAVNILVRSKKVSAYLTNPNQPAWPQIDQRVVSDSGFSKSITNVHPISPSPVQLAGRSLLSEVDSPTMLSHAVPQLRERLLLWLMPETKYDSLS